MASTNTNSTLSNEGQTLLTKINHQINLQTEKLKYKLNLTSEIEKKLNEEIEYGTITKINYDPKDRPYFDGTSITQIPLNYIVKLNNGKIIPVNVKDDLIIGRYKKGDGVQVSIETHTKTTKDYIKNNFDKKEIINTEILATRLSLLCVCYKAKK